tara:strand:- start:16 stop:213 length:198 start_codon:yes stop_codon:yes gene_type:complete
MALKKSSKSAAEECCAKCESDIAALRKEIAALKRELGKKSAGGADPRVDKLWDALVRMGKEKFLK